MLPCFISVYNFRFYTKQLTVGFCAANISDRFKPASAGLRPRYERNDPRLGARDTSPWIIPYGIGVRPM